LESNGLKSMDAASPALFESLLKNDLHVRVRVTGKSMSPFLRGGEIVHIKRVHPGTLKRGDLVLFRNEDRLLLLHRVIDWKRGTNGRITFQTLGDRLFRPDDPVPGDRLLGKVSRIEKRGPGHRIRMMNLEDPGWVFLSRVLAFIHLVKSISYGFLVKPS